MTSSELAGTADVAEYQRQWSYGRQPPTVNILNSKEGISGTSQATILLRHVLGTAAGGAVDGWCSHVIIRWTLDSADPLLLAALSLPDAAGAGFVSLRWSGSSCSRGSARPQLQPLSLPSWYTLCVMLRWVVAFPAPTFLSTYSDNLGGHR